MVERPALERRILASLDASRIPVLLGGCGIGRSSLLRRLAVVMGADRGQYLDLAACATTPERCLAAVVDATTGASASAPSSQIFSPSPEAAFHALLDLFDQPAGDGPRTFLIDDALEFRTFENFPGLRHVQRDAIARLARSPNRFVLASRFTARAHRLLRDAPARFEVIHVPPLDPRDVLALALVRDGRNPDTARVIAPAITALSGGRIAYAAALVDALTERRSDDVLAALGALLASDGRITALARFSYEFRLHRARGYGALKAILGIVAETEGLNLTEIAHRLHRTPGSTKDYLSWLEDVDVLTVRRKRYAFDDPILRLYVRLYGRAVPPSEADIAREVEAYVIARVPTADALPATGEPALAAGDGPRNSGIIEID